MTVVVLDEVKSGDWGISGASLTTADAKPWRPEAQKADRRAKSANPELPGWFAKLKMQATAGLLHPVNPRF